ncbi:MAG: DUF3996 domain-containing protein [Nitrospirae bacterium]|nr:MAG: DUF3996 domain-containing protein [Nitrospirota bacterium]
MKGALSCLLISLVLVAACPRGIQAENYKNQHSIGLIMGDPIAISFKTPINESAFLNLRLGMWAWHFWHDVMFNTPYLSVDYAWSSPFGRFKLPYYMGVGIAAFFRDNPKDERNYDAALAIRVPIGIELASTGRFSLNFEIAPIYQAVPPFSFEPYIIELNGGMLLRYNY